MEARQLSLDDLDCPVCCEVMEAPIRTCVVSHNICDSCFSNVTVCPLCRGEINGDRNYELEGFGRSLIYNCTNKLEGCDFQAPLEVIKKHNEFCRHTVSECPLSVLDNCRWSGKIQEITNHCLTKHHNNTFRGNKQTLLCINFLEVPDLYVTVLKRYQIVLEAHGKLFKIVWGLNSSTGFTLWRVIYCGPSEDAAKYRFNLEFQNPLCLQDKVQLQGECQPESLETTVLDTMFVRIHQRELINYCSGMNLYYTVSIRKASEEQIEDCNMNLFNAQIIVPKGCINRF